MRKIRHRPAWTVIVGLAGLAADAVAQETYYYPPYVPPAQSSVYNQNSVYLPTPPTASGQDMVRGSTGVTCQTAEASGGPYVDIGMIGAQDVFNRDTAAVYGRVVVPLGKRPDRPDCTKLYELELARMQMELDLMRLGLPDFGGPPPAPAPAEAKAGEEVQGTPAVIGMRPEPQVAEPKQAAGPEEAPSLKSKRSTRRTKPVREFSETTYLSALRP
jgi:hypothetical protein